MVVCRALYAPIRMASPISGSEAATLLEVRLAGVPSPPPPAPPDEEEDVRPMESISKLEVVGKPRKGFGAPIQ
jgi:hypothetical protein